jgi:hypothetical protein
MSVLLCGEFYTTHEEPGWTKIKGSGAILFGTEFAQCMISNSIGARMAVASVGYRKQEVHEQTVGN